MSINFTTLATGALGFTVALAWNNAVSHALKSYFPPHDERAAARHTIAYAVVITVLVILVVAVVNHARKLVYACGLGRGPERDRMLARRVPGRGCAGCADCAHCFPRVQGLAPIVRLWEPPPGG